jgi:VWFA-related protein
MSVKTAASVLVLSLSGMLAASGQPPSFRSGVELVEITVVARDADGRIVRDLKQSDFRVLERGMPQRIAAFERVSIPQALPSPRGPSLQAASDVASNDVVDERRVFVLVLDALHVASERTQAVRKHAIEFVEAHVGPADLTAVLSPGGLASATQDFTSDKPRLLAAIQQFAGSKIRSATVEVAEEEAARQRDPIAVALHNGKDPSDEERAGRAEALADVLDALARHLGRVAHRRTTVLLFSEGIDYDVSDVTSRVQRYGSDIIRANKRAVDGLMHANASVYAIDPRGLASSVGDHVESSVFNASPSVVTGPSVEREYADSIRSLRHLSESTGGFAVVDRTDFTSAFTRIVEESSEYYVVGYTPETPGRPGDFRDITVQVDRPGVHVIARKGYAIPSPPPAPAAVRQPEEPAAPLALRDPFGRRGAAAPELVAPARTALAGDLNALLASPLPTTGLLLRVQAIPFRGDERKSVVDVVVEVVGRSLRFAERGGRFDERIELALMTVDGSARAANGRSATFDLHLTPDQYQGVSATGIRWISRLEIPAGHYQVRVAGRARQTAVSGLVTRDVDVPTFEGDRLYVSGVTITSLPSVLAITQGIARLASALKTPPSTSRTFVSGDQMTVAVEVYEPSSIASAEVAALIEDTQGVRTPVGRKIATGQHRTRLDPVVFVIDTKALGAGSHVLRIEATPATGGDPVIHRVPFEIIVH